MSPGNIASPPLRSASVCSTLSASVLSPAFFGADGVDGNAGRLRVANDLSKALVTGVVFSVGYHHQDLCHPLALGIGCQFPAGIRHRIEERSATSSAQLVDTAGELFVVAGEILRDRGRIGKPCDKPEVRGVAEHLLQELCGSVLFEREPLLHGPAGINQQTQAQRKLGLRS